MDKKELNIVELKAENEKLQLQLLAIKKEYESLYLQYSENKFIEELLDIAKSRGIHYEDLTIHEVIMTMKLHQIELDIFSVYELYNRLKERYKFKKNK